MFMIFTILCVTPWLFMYFLTFQIFECLASVYSLLALTHSRDAQWMREFQEASQLSLYPSSGRLLWSGLLKQPSQKKVFLVPIRHCSLSYAVCPSYLIWISVFLALLSLNCCVIDSDSFREKLLARKKQCQPQAGPKCIGFCISHIITTYIHFLWLSDMAFLVVSDHYRSCKLLA